MAVCDPQTFELLDSRVGSFFVCCKFKSLQDNFVWDLIGVCGPNGEICVLPFLRS